MATRITGHKWSASPGSIYPWDEWLDGGAWELTPGEDFTVARDAFRNAAYAAARARNGRVRTTCLNGHFIIQFTPGDKP